MLWPAPFVGIARIDVRAASPFTAARFVSRLKQLKPIPAARVEHEFRTKNLESSQILSQGEACGLMYERLASP